MYRDAGKLIFWRRMAPKLKTMANDDSLKELKKKLKLKNKQEKGRESDNNSNLGQKLKKQTPQLANKCVTKVQIDESITERSSFLRLANLGQGDIEMQRTISNEMR